MTAVNIVLAVLAVGLVVATALPVVRKPYWWVRAFDFPRAQLAAGCVLVLVLFGAVNVGSGGPGALEWVLLALLAAATLYQGWRMLPYTLLKGVQTQDADGVADGRTLRLVISNVLMQNRQGDHWLRTIRAEDPDVVVAVETDSWWAETAGALKETHPHAVEIPQDDTYGMCVYSRLPLVQTEVRHLVEEEVPSLFLTARLPSGEPVRLVFLHPRPPRPDIRQDSTLRDAELVLAGHEIATYDQPVVVAGDLNDVAWSYTTSLFQRIAGVLDPRVGRGMFATFHADHWWLRYPLDHVFHTEHFTLVDIRRLGHVGSDHFPMMIELAVDPAKRPLQKAPEEDREDVEHAAEVLEEEGEMKAKETPEEKAERVAEDV